MTGILEGQRFWKRGDHSHVWVVDAIVPAENGHPPIAVLVNEDGRVTEDVDLIPKVVDIDPFHGAHRRGRAH